VSPNYRKQQAQESLCVFLKCRGNLFFQDRACSIDWRDGLCSLCGINGLLISYGWGLHYGYESLLGVDTWGVDKTRASGCRLYKKLREMKGTNLESVLLEGNPSDELIRYAEEEKWMFLSWLCHIRQLLICDHRFHYKKHIWFIWSNDDVFTVNVT